MEGGGHLRVEVARQDPGGHFHQGNVETGGDQVLGDLQADKTRPDHQGLPGLAVTEKGFDPVRIGDVPQGKDVVTIESGDGWTDRCGPG